MNGKLGSSKKSIRIFSPYIRYYRRKLVVHDSWQFAQSTAWITAILVLILQIANRLWPIRNSTSILLGIVFTWLTAIAVSALRIPKSPMSVAWRVDQDLKLKERFSSTVEFSNVRTSENPTLEIFLTKQREETLSALKSIKNQSSFRLTFSAKHLISSALITALAVILVIIPNPMDELIQLQDSIAEASEIQAEKIEELIEEIQEDDELSPEEKENLLLQLASLAEKLRNNQGDLAEALADLSRAESELLKRLDPQLDFKQTALNSISQQLSELAKLADANDPSDSSTDEIMDALADQLAEMDQAERLSLSQSLQKMAAQAAQAGEASLAQALSALSQSAQSGDTESTRKDGENLAKNLDQAENQMADQQSIEKALSQLQQSRMSLSQSSTANGNPSQNSSQGNEGNPAQASGQSQNSTNGQTPGQGTSPGGSGGSKANTLPGFNSSGQAQDPTGAGQNANTGDLGDQIAVPWDRLQGNVDPLSISGQDTGQGQTDVKEQNSPLPGSSSISFIPYTEVYGSYLNTAYDTLENSYIPAGLKEYVLKYFSLLEP